MGTQRGGCKNAVVVSGICAEIVRHSLRYHRISSTLIQRIYSVLFVLLCTYNDWAALPWRVQWPLCDKKEQNSLTRGPRAMAPSPEWQSHCRHADIMQHFSNPIIATNKWIIIKAVLSFEEEYMGMTVNGAWSFEQTLNHISTVGSMWKLVEIG